MQQNEGKVQMVAGDRAALEGSRSIVDGSQQQAHSHGSVVPDCDLSINQAPSGQAEIKSEIVR